MIKTLARYTTILLIAVAGLVYVSYAASQPAEAQASAFITTWKTDQTTPSGRSITIPTASNLDYDYTVDWGDGNIDSSNTGPSSHTYAEPGTYQVKITGDFPRIYFRGHPGNDALLSVDAWGATPWVSMVDAFDGCANVQILAQDTPNLSQVTSLSGMFRGATSMNSPIGNWNTSSVRSIVSMFERARSFNQSLNGWNTDNMQMFTYAFRGASSFNGAIGNWNMSNALSTSGMFADAENFNQPIGGWNVAKVKDMRNMFHNAIAFNQDVAQWNTASATRMESVFRNAIRFEQDISTWNFASLTNADFMFSGTRLSGTNYDKLLVALADAETGTNITLDAGASSYCQADIARSYLIAEKNWTLLDNGKDTNNCSAIDLRFTSGVGAVLAENSPLGTVAGILRTIHPDPENTFSYAFCSNATEDSRFFSLANGQLTALESFDYEKPLDRNLDNVYDLCIASTDRNGFILQRLLTVAVTDVDDDPTSGVNQPNDGNTTGNGTQNGQVLATSTDTPSSQSADPAVLAAGKVLAATGAKTLLGYYVGTGLIAAALLLYQIYKKHTA